LNTVGRTHPRGDDRSIAELASTDRGLRGQPEELQRQEHPLGGVELIGPSPLHGRGSGKEHAWAEGSSRQVTSTHRSLSSRSSGSGFLSVLPEQAPIR